MIKSLRIQNFKCWKDTGEFRLAPITGFFGTNSSGKSSILQFLLMLKQTVDVPDPLRVLNLGVRDDDYVRFGSFGDIAFGPVSGSLRGEIEWSFTWRLPYSVRNGLRSGLSGEPDDSQRLRIPVIDYLTFKAKIDETPIPVTALKSLEVVEFAYSFQDSYGKADRVGMKRTGDRVEYSFVYDDSGGADSAPMPAGGLPVKCYGFPIRLLQQMTHLQTVSDFLLHLRAQFESLFGTVDYLGPLRAEPQSEYRWTGAEPSRVGARGEFAVEALLASSRNGPAVETQVADWLKGMSLIDSFTIDELSAEGGLFRVNVKPTVESAFVSIANVGFGISQVLPVLVMCARAMHSENETSILILEQPELHLHPKAQMELADVLVEVANSGKVQIILESHSEHLLTRLQRRIAENVITKDDVALYFCEKDESEAELKPLNVNNFGYITNWPQDFFGDEMGERTAMMKEALRREKEGEAA